MHAAPAVTVPSSTPIHSQPIDHIKTISSQKTHKWQVPSWSLPPTPVNSCSLNGAHLVVDAFRPLQNSTPVVDVDLDQGWLNLLTSQQLGLTWSSEMPDIWDGKDATPTLWPVLVLNWSNWKRSKDVGLLHMYRSSSKAFDQVLNE